MESLLSLTQKSLHVFPYFYNYFWMDIDQYITLECTIYNFHNIYCNINDLENIHSYYLSK